MWTMMTGCSRVPPCRLRPLQGPFRSTEVWVRAAVWTGSVLVRRFTVGPWTAQVCINADYKCIKKTTPSCSPSIQLINKSQNYEISVGAALVYVPR